MTVSRLEKLQSQFIVQKDRPGGSYDLTLGFFYSSLDDLKNLFEAWVLEGFQLRKLVVDRDYTLSVTDPLIAGPRNLLTFSLVENNSFYDDATNEGRRILVERDIENVSQTFKDGDLMGAGLNLDSLVRALNNALFEARRSLKTVNSDDNTIFAPDEGTQDYLKDHAIIWKGGQYRLDSKLPEDAATASDLAKQNQTDIAQNRQDIDTNRKEILELDDSQRTQDSAISRERERNDQQDNQIRALQAGGGGGMGGGGNYPGTYPIQDADVAVGADVNITKLASHDANDREKLLGVGTAPGANPPANAPNPINVIDYAPSNFVNLAERDPSIKTALENVNREVVSLRTGYADKMPVRAATTGPITIAQANNSSLRIDGVTLVTGDRALIKNQAGNIGNGVYHYLVFGDGTRRLDRVQDVNTLGELFTAHVFVEEGDVNIGSGWTCTLPDPKANSGDAIGNTANEWVKRFSLDEHFFRSFLPISGARPMEGPLILEADAPRAGVPGEQDAVPRKYVDDAVATAGIDFDALPTTTAIDPKDQMLFNQPEAKTTITNRESITNEGGAKLGNMRSATFNLGSVAAPNNETWFYITTAGVTSLGLGSVNDSIDTRPPTNTPYRILELHHLTRQGLECAILIRPGRSTASWVVTLLMVDTVGLQGRLNFRVGGQAISNIDSYEASEGFINGVAVGGYSWNTVRTDLLPLFATPGDMIFQIDPPDSDQQGEFRPRFSLFVADAQSTPKGLKVEDTEEFLEQIAHNQALKNAAAFADARKTRSDLDSLIAHLGQRGSTLTSINGFGFTAPSYAAFVGALNPTSRTYTLDVIYTLSAAEVSTLEKLTGGTHIEIVLNGLSAYFPYSAGSFKEGQNTARFTVSEVGADTYIGGTLDSQGKGFIDIDFRYVSLSSGRPTGAVDERITRISFQINPDFSLENLIHMWALRSFSGKIPAEFLPETSGGGSGSVRDGLVAGDSGTTAAPIAPLPFSKSNITSIDTFRYLRQNTNLFQLSLSRTKFTYRKNGKDVVGVASASDEATRRIALSQNDIDHLHAARFTVSFPTFQRGVGYNAGAIDSYYDSITSARLSSDAATYWSARVGNWQSLTAVNAAGTLMEMFLAYVDSYNATNQTVTLILKRGFFSHYAENEVSTSAEIKFETPLRTNLSGTVTFIPGQINWIYYHTANQVFATSSNTRRTDRPDIYGPNLGDSYILLSIVAMGLVSTNASGSAIAAIHNVDLLSDEDSHNDLVWRRSGNRMICDAGGTIRKKGQTVVVPPGTVWTRPAGLRSEGQVKRTIYLKPDLTFTGDEIDGVNNTIKHPTLGAAGRGHPVHNYPAIFDVIVDDKGDLTDEGNYEPYQRYSTVEKVKKEDYVEVTPSNSNSTRSVNNLLIESVIRRAAGIYRVLFREGAYRDNPQAKLTTYRTGTSYVVAFDVTQGNQKGIDIRSYDYQGNTQNNFTKIVASFSPGGTDLQQANKDNEYPG